MPAPGTAAARAARQRQACCCEAGSRVDEVGFGTRHGPRFEVGGHRVA